MNSKAGAGFTENFYGSNEKEDAMSKAKEGDRVKVHYSGFLEDGTIFDSSLKREPLEFTLGTGMVIPGFDRAILGMGVGDDKTVQIEAAEGYGTYNNDLIAEVPRSMLPQDITPEVGLQLNVRTRDGQQKIVSIAEVKDESLVLDANHVLAGKDLIFEIKLVDIVS
jgi:peptidylprolyl isomerase